VKTKIGFAAIILAAAPVLAEPLPPPGSAQFCARVQQELASTAMTGQNTVFTDMPSYRHSKPAAKPHAIYQVVTYDKSMPVVVSCKVKTAAHLRAEYGADAAGEQKFCPHMAQLLRQQAVDELTSEAKPEAAARAAAFVIDKNEPFIAGNDYLADFRAIYAGADGAVHISSPGLYQDYDAWYTFLLPEIVQGQSYCHLATVEMIKAVAAGEMPPGTVFTTADDAPTQPR